MSQTTAPKYGDTIVVSTVVNKHYNLVAAQRDVDQWNSMAFEGQRYEAVSTGTAWNIVLHQDETKNIAGYGDWVVLADGTKATVIKMGPTVNVPSGRQGTYYHLMLQGGTEIALTHWFDDQDHVHTDSGFGRESEAQALFTVFGA